jgi:hypothetical protein
MAIAALALAWLVTPASAQQTDLAAIPADGLLFAHLRAADVWRSPLLAEFRDMVARAGPKAFEIYTRRFPVSAANIERLTLIGIPGPPEAPSRVPPPLVIVSLNKPIDPAQLSSLLGPGAREIGGVKTFTDNRGAIAVHMIDAQTLIVSEPQTVTDYLGRPKARDGPLSKAKEFANKKHLTIGVNFAAMPREEFAKAPPPIQPLLKANLGVATVELGNEITLDVQLHYVDSKSAVAAEKAARDALDIVRAELQKAKKDVGKAVLEPATPAPASIHEFPEALASFAGLAAIGNADETLAKLPLKRDGATLSIQAKVPAQAAPVVPLAMLGAVAMYAWRTQSAAPPAPPPPILPPPEGRGQPDGSAAALHSTPSFRIAGFDGGLGMRNRSWTAHFATGRNDW